MTRSEILTNVFTQLKNAGYVRNKSDFSQRLNYSLSYLSSAFSGNRETHLSDNLFATILRVFPQVNEVYIRTGYGNVLRAGSSGIFTGILPNANAQTAILECLLAEREALQQSLTRINEMISLISTQDLKSAC